MSYLDFCTLADVLNPARTDEHRIMCDGAPYEVPTQAELRVFCYLVAVDRAVSIVDAAAAMGCGYSVAVRAFAGLEDKGLLFRRSGTVTLYSLRRPTVESALMAAPGTERVTLPLRADAFTTAP